MRLHLHLSRGLGTRSALYPFTLISEGFDLISPSRKKSRDDIQFGGPHWDQRPPEATEEIGRQGKLRPINDTIRPFLH